MKRAFLIAGGTVGGLGAVLAITPPQLNSTTSTGSLSGSLGVGSGNGAQATTVAATQAAAATTPAATKSAKSKTVASKASKKASTAASASASASSSTATQSQTQTSSSPTPTPTKSTPAATSGGYSGTVTGSTVAARNYGNLTATVVFKDGKIASVSASQSPMSWSQQSLSALIPYVNGGKITIEQIKQYSAETLPCAISNSCNSRASFSATAFWASIKSAISKAGL